MIIKNIISDFDNVAYAHTQDCPERQLHAAALVGQAYFDISYQEARDNALQSWNEYKNGFYYALKDHPEIMESLTFHELYRAQASLSQDAMHGVVCSETVGLINQISAKHNFIFASHSSLRSVQNSGHAIGVNSALMEYGTYGMDTLGVNGGQRKDDPYSKVYPWLCKENGFDLSETAMAEDTAINLIGAKKEGLITVHIHWGKPVKEGYIDFSFETSYEAFSFLDKAMNNNNVVSLRHMALKIA